MLIVQVGEELL